MRQPTPAHLGPVPTPRVNSKMSLVLWASFGFVLGFLPIIIFLLFISGTRNDRLTQLATQLAAVASREIPTAMTNTATAISPPEHDHASAPQPEAAPVAVPAQEVKPPPLAPAATSLAQTKTASLAKDSASETNPSSSSEPLADKKPLKKIGAGKNKQQNKIQHPAKTQRVATAKRLTAVLPEHKSSIELRAAVNVESIVNTIVTQRWEQSSSETIFPLANAIDCATEKNEVVCWTGVLTGKYNSSVYHYKIKLILDKFSTDKPFVMTYRDLILNRGGKSNDEDAAGLGALPEAIRPGWAPMIHRLPCKLVGQDVIVCSPVGESQFVLKATGANTHSEN